MNAKLDQGTNYVKEKSEEVKTYAMEKKAETEEYVNGQVEKTRDLLKKQWDAVYETTMYIPSKMLKITGEVFVSTREIVFAYAQVSFRCRNDIVNILFSFTDPTPLRYAHFHKVC